MSTVSLGNNLAKGCTENGRYIALFEVSPRLRHMVCLVKNGKDVKIIDTFIQEKLEQEGHLAKQPERCFTKDEYVHLLKLIGTNLLKDCRCQVYGSAATRGCQS